MSCVALSSLSLCNNSNANVDTLCSLPPFCLICEKGKILHRDKLTVNIELVKWEPPYSHTTCGVYIPHSVPRLKRPADPTEAITTSIY